MSLHLTFDDGPSEWTPLILDLLAEHDVKATFFVIGQHIERNEHIVRRAIEEGHQIGNHTWTHRRLSGLTGSEHQMELRATQHVIVNMFGIEPGVWRAPFYDHSTLDKLLCPRLGLWEHMGADIVPEDCFTDDPDQIALRVIAGIPFVDGRPAVVSLHDGIPPDGGSSSCTQSRQPTVDAVRLILKAIA